MTELKENQIEQIIYNSPWLIDERFTIPKIKGSRNENGRQINIGQDNSRFIDLLFKDTRDNRPVIVELKKGNLTRENIAQILEYRGLITSLNNENRNQWLSEFGQNYYAPKMLLIGSEADETIKISANLAGIEIRLFGSFDDNMILSNSFQDLNTKLKEWNNFRNTGNRTLMDRDEWIINVIEQTNNAVCDNFSSITTINKPTTNSRNVFFPCVFPFINIPIYYNDESIIGIYEYYNNELPFDETYFYCEVAMELEDIKKRQMKKIEKMDFEIISPYNNPILKIPRTMLEDNNEYKDFLHNIVEITIEIADNK
ncbi:hypothetical protein DMA11_06705 [Marinilabiliaceae bacterium JC017]|nr:hypothetical protein DMA11_06705 [Marinilabiliaceae bacterium JC017]